MLTQSPAVLFINAFFLLSLLHSFIHPVIVPFRMYIENPLWANPSASIWKYRYKRPSFDPQEGCLLEGRRRKQWFICRLIWVLMGSEYWAVSVLNTDWWALKSLHLKCDLMDEWKQIRQIKVKERQRASQKERTVCAKAQHHQNAGCSPLPASHSGRHKHRVQRQVTGSLRSSHSRELKWSHEITQEFRCWCLHAQSLHSFSTVTTLWTIAHQAPLSMGFSWQEYWRGLPFPPPGDFPNPRMEHVSCVSPALQADSLPTEQPSKPSDDGKSPQMTLLCSKVNMLWRGQESDHKLGKYTRGCFFWEFQSGATLIWWLELQHIHWLYHQLESSEMSTPLQNETCGV